MNVDVVNDRIIEAAVHEAWVTGFMAALRQGDSGVYVNFLGDEGEARVCEAYPGPTLGPAQGDQAPLRPDQPLPAQIRTSHR